MKCQSCVTGCKHKELFKARKEKSISRTEWKEQSSILGGICIECVHNGIKGAKAYAVKKLMPSFQSQDLYVPVETRYRQRE